MNGCAIYLSCINGIQYIEAHCYSKKVKVCQSQDMIDSFQYPGTFCGPEHNHGYCQWQQVRKDFCIHLLHLIKRVSEGVVGYTYANN